MLHLMKMFQHTNMEITIKHDKLPILIEKAGKWIFTPDAELSLSKLLELKDKVDEAITKVKEILYESGKGVNIAGDELSFYVAKGEPYKFSGDKAELPKELKKTITFEKFNPYAVSTYKGKLPKGISAQDKPKLIIRKIHTQNEKIESVV